MAADSAPAENALLFGGAVPDPKNFDESAAGIFPVPD